MLQEDLLAAYRYKKRKRSARTEYSHVVSNKSRKCDSLSGKDDERSVSAHVNLTNVSDRPFPDDIYIRRKFVLSDKVLDS